jgi:ABC-type glycerol-3-phosphate transport system substrate-binding protein
MIRNSLAGAAMMALGLTLAACGGGDEAGKTATAPSRQAVTAATVLGVTVGVLLAEVVAGVAVGAGTAVVFHFVLRSIIARK